jgi:SAM-dependent methyltransferase
MIPPKWMIFTRPGDFISVGRGLLQILRDVGGLEPEEGVLDVGCGIGRMAIVLTEYLGPEGSYDGFDVVREGIEWCQAHITPRFPRFRAGAPAACRWVDESSPRRVPRHRTAVWRALP